MIFEDSFKTIAGRAEGVYRDKGSKFIAVALPVSSEDEAKEQLGFLINEFHNAQHHCYAYVIGPEKLIYRFNDDGEPPGTAGRPIYGQILSKELTEILVVVIRYFGGIKLGVRGLINAYKSAAEMAISNAKIMEMTVNVVCEIRFDYSEISLIMKLIKEENLKIIEHRFELVCSVLVLFRRCDLKRVAEKFSKVKGVNLKYIKTVSK